MNIEDKKECSLLKQKTIDEFNASLNLIRNGHWSNTFRSGDIFFKQLKYPTKYAIDREISASLRAYQQGVNTPLCHGKFIFNEIVYIAYQFVDMHAFEASQIATIPCLKSKILNLFDILTEVEWDPTDNYWNTSLIPEFIDALRYVNENYRINDIIIFLKSLQPYCFIHGDLTIDNLGISNIDSSLYVYDFQHGSYGPKGWDRAMFAGSEVCGNMDFIGLTNQEIIMSYCVSLIRYGRSIRKMASNVDKRKLIVDSWLKYIRDKEIFI